MTTREKLIEAAKQAFQDNERRLGGCCYGTDEAFAYEGQVPLSEIVDAILEAMREPDEGAAEAGREFVADYNLAIGDSSAIAAGRAFTAMIDHLRSGKPAAPNP